MMLTLLIKKQLAEIFRAYFYNVKKNKARSKVAVIGYFIFFAAVMLGVLGGLFTGLSLMLCQPLTEAGMSWLYFAIMGMLSVFLGVFGSVFNTYAGLYLAKDNDLLLSMPIPVKTIMMARLTAVYLMGLLYSGVVMLPAVIVYWVVGTASVMTVLGGLLLLFLISMLVLSLSCGLGWVVAKVSMKIKNKSFITVLISLLFFVGYYGLCMSAGSIIEDLVKNILHYGTLIKGKAYPLYVFGQVGVGDWKAMLVVSAVVLGLFAILWLLMARSFLHIATSTGVTSRKVYKATLAKQKTVAGALFAKELRRFTSSPLYMLNCSLSSLFMPIAGIVLLWKGREILPMVQMMLMGQQEGLLPTMLVAVVMMMASMNYIVAPSISLEGKNLWLMQSLPIKPWQVLRGKLQVHLVFTAVPVAFVLICMAVVMKYAMVELLLTALVLFAAVAFFALFDLFCGVMMPNLHWVSEITPIKQGAAVVVSMLGGIVYTLLYVGGYFLLNRWPLGYVGYLTLWLFLTLLADLGLWVLLRSRGTKRFASL